MMPSEEAYRDAEKKLGLMCPECGSRQMHRMQREGLMQVVVYPFFGYFPWECAECKESFLLKKRYKRKFKSSRGDAEENPGNGDFLPNRSEARGR